MKPADIPARLETPAPAIRISVLWLAQAALLLLDIFTGPDLSLLSYFALPSMVAASFAAPRQVVLLAAAALLSGVVVGWQFGVLTSLEFMLRLGALASVGALVVVLDIARSRHAAEAKGASDRIRATLDSLLDPHVLLRAVRDENGQIKDFIFADANQAACQYNKMPRERMVGGSLLGILPEHVASGLFELYRQTIESGDPLVLDDYLYPHDILEEPRYYDIRAVKIGDALSFTWRDVTERHKVSTVLEQRVKTDELTMLLNRREVFARLDGLRGKRPRTGHDIAVLFVDLDRFKAINDAYGHAVGDAVLRTTGERVRSCLRHSDDLGGRVGGDEMMVVLHGIHGIRDAMQVAEKLRRYAARPVRVDGRSIEATVSIGVAIARTNESMGALVARADAAMYAAKKHGRNQVITVDHAMAA